MSINKKLYFGWGQPFFGGPQGVMSQQYDEDLIRNDLVQLLLTLPGERRYRPTFGTVLKAVVFETLDANYLSSIKNNILNAIANHDERIDVKSLNLTMNDDKHRLDVQLVFSVNGQPAKNYFVGLGIGESAIITLDEVG